MQEIRFSSELHYITRDSVSPKALDEETLLSFLRSATAFFRSISRLIAAEKKYCSNKASSERLTTNQYLARYCHKSLKNGLSHRKTTEQLFNLAQESESLLHYLISSTWELAEDFQQPYQTCFREELVQTEDRMIEQCERVIKSQRVLVAC